jgi:lysophospholipase L1-like esterase
LVRYLGVFFRRKNMHFTAAPNLPLPIRWIALGSVALFGVNSTLVGCSSSSNTPSSTGSGGAGGGAATGGATSVGGAAGGAGAGGVANVGGSTHTGPWKIMMLGDSITATTCYPQLLSKNLISAGHTNFQLIGSFLNNQSCGATNVLTEGHSGELVVTDTNNGSISNWLTANPPDAVVMHFATNDVWGNPGTSTANGIITAYTTILTQLRTVNPNAVLFVAQIIPVNPSANNCSAAAPCNYEAAVDSLIPAWANSQTTTTSPVIAVNLETLFTNGYFPNSTYTTDGVHPLPAGSQLMADTLTPVIIANLPGI